MMMQCPALVPLLLMATATCTRAAGCYCRDANGCAANNGCQCYAGAAADIGACLAIKGSWSSSCCTPPNPPAPPNSNSGPGCSTGVPSCDPSSQYGNQSWMAEHGLLCPNDDMTKCDNGGKCGACFMEVPRDQCTYGRGLPVCDITLPFGSMCIPRRHNSISSQDPSWSKLDCGVSRHINSACA